MDTTVACPTCGLVQRVEGVGRGMVAECVRCGTTLRSPKTNSLARTAAFSLAALMFYVPANIYPILHMEIYGVRSENTIWDGTVALYRQGEALVATIVLLASLVTPFLKLVGLFYLVISVKLGSRRRRILRTWIYRGLDVIGPWAMLDVFLLAILVSLVKLGQLATVTPGRGLIAFTAVVVLTILATTSFDPVLIWTNAEETS